MVCADKGKISEATKRIEDLGKELGMIFLHLNIKEYFFVMYLKTHNFLFVYFLSILLLSVVYLFVCLSRFLTYGFECVIP